VPGGLISDVAPGGLADRVALRPGDELLTVNGHELRDTVDVQFYAADELLDLTVRRAGDVLALSAERRLGEPLGLSFVEEPTFDGIRRCRNQCEFCFVNQMPPGMRPTLYVKDDDYRYSFLSGSYITLTNLAEEDWRRIEEQRLSPLYVSVHAVEPGLRRQLLGNPGAPDVLPQLQRLIDSGIELHTQAVLAPRLNDGQHLERTIRSLAALYPGVRSLSIVPVGLTRYHGRGCRGYSISEMRDVFDLVVQWQETLSGELGVRFGYLSDEWYLRLGESVPPLAAYDGLDLTENGVGLVRQFLESHEWRNQLSLPAYESLTVVTGVLFSSVLRKACEPLKQVKVVAVVNEFFGESVTVAGLLTGRDVIAQLQGRDLGARVALPPAMFGGPGGQSLDEMAPADIAGALGRPVVLAAI